MSDRVSTLGLYHDIKSVIEAFPEPPVPTAPPELRGYLRQPDRLRWIAELSADGFDGDFCEIGAMVGATTRMLAELAETYDRRVLVVDPWDAKVRGCHPWDYDLFMANTQEYRDRIDVVRASSMSEEARQAMRSRPLCFAYVDGLHAKMACLSDMRAVSHTAGVIAVDDILWSKFLLSAFEEAADELWRVPISMLGTPSMREGYLLPAGTKPTKIGVRRVAMRVRAAMRVGMGLSVIRLGDGEAALMAWPEFTKRRAPLFESLRYWFGMAQFSSGDLDRMADGLRSAISNADIIGVPSAQHRKDRKGWADVEPYLRIYNVATDCLLANADLHIEMLTSGALGDILRDVESVTVITCRDVVDHLKAEYGVTDVRWYPVPVEAQTAGFAATNHWPDRFEELMNEISVPEPGHLFLVGAGALGKVYCARVKELGGVALDLGSVFDVWAGVNSRSYMDELG